MNNQAKKILELQRRVQQSFLNIEEHCNPRTLLNRKRAGASTGFQLGRTIDDLTAEIADIRGTENDQMEVVSDEIDQLERSSSRLNAILRLMNATKALYCMNQEEARLLIKKSEEEFNLVCERYPFDKDDIEARAAHIVYCLFMTTITDQNLTEPCLSESYKPPKREFKTNSKSIQFCEDIEKQAEKTIDAVTTTLHLVGEIQQQDVFTTEEFLEEIKQSGTPHDWLPSLKLEQFKISDRAQKVLDDLTDLIDKAAGNQSDLCFARSATSILRLYVVRAQPEQHCGVDAAVFFNDCLFIAVGLERAKFHSIYKLQNPTDAFNFGRLLTTLRATSRNTLIRDLIHVKEHFLTWPANAMTDYLNGTNNKFGEVLIQLKRFSGLWGDVCSQSVYALLMFLVCAHILSLLVDTLIALPNFERSTCCKVLPLVNEIIQTCSGHIRASEKLMKKAFVDTKSGRALMHKISGLKQSMSSQGADQSLTELFDFQLVA